MKKILIISLAFLAFTACKKKDVNTSDDVVVVEVKVDELKLITFSKVVSRMFFVESQDLIVPVCVVKVLFAAKVPVTSLTTKWALTDKSGELSSL